MDGTKSMYNIEMFINLSINSLVWAFPSLPTDLSNLFGTTVFITKFYAVSSLLLNASTVFEFW